MGQAVADGGTYIRSTRRRAAPTRASFRRVWHRDAGGERDRRCHREFEKGFSPHPHPPLPSHRAPPLPPRGRGSNAKIGRGNTNEERRVGEKCVSQVKNPVVPFA